MWKTSAFIILQGFVLVSLANSQSTPSFTCPYDGFHAYNESQCVPEYWVCIDGVAYADVCPPSSVFDPKVKHCVPEKEASCYDGFVCSSDDGFFSEPGPCTSNYWACIDGEAYPQRCMNNAVFDPEKGYCTSFDQASCKDDFVCPPEDGFYANPGICITNYWACIDGVAYPQTCPQEEYVFDPLVERCVSASNASCNQMSS